MFFVSVIDMRLPGCCVFTREICVLHFILNNRLVHTGNYAVFLAEIGYYLKLYHEKEIHPFSNLYFFLPYILFTRRYPFKILPG